VAALSSFVVTSIVSTWGPAYVPCWPVMSMMTPTATLQIWPGTLWQVPPGRSVETLSTWVLTSPVPPPLASTTPRSLALTPAAPPQLTSPRPGSLALTPCGQASLAPPPAPAPPAALDVAAGVPPPAVLPPPLVLPLPLPALLPLEHPVRSASASNDIETCLL